MSSILSCRSCAAVWSEGAWKADCEECGGGALKRDCPRCEGVCGEVWERALDDSWSAGVGHWVGRCLLVSGGQRSQPVRESVTSLVGAGTRALLASSAAPEDQMLEPSSQEERDEFAAALVGQLASLFASEPAGELCVDFDSCEITHARAVSADELWLLGTLHTFAGTDLLLFAQLRLAPASEELAALVAQVAPREWLSRAEWSDFATGLEAERFFSRAERERWPLRVRRSWSADGGRHA